MNITLRSVDIAACRRTGRAGHPDSNSPSPYDQLAACCARLNCADTADCVTAERAALAYLDGSCQTPIAALAEIRLDGRISLGLSVLSEDGAQKFDISDTADRQDAAQLGRSCAERLLAQCGGRDFLA